MLANQMQETNPTIFSAILLGDCVGKTTLLNRLINNRYTINPPATVGIDTASLLIGENKKRRLMIMDVCSQEESSKLWGPFCELADFVILAFSLINRKSYANITRLWAKIYDFSQMPIILLGTTLDKTTDREWAEVSFEEGEQLAKEINAISYIECSALRDNGIDSVLNAFSDVIYRLEEEKGRLSLNSPLPGFLQFSSIPAHVPRTGQVMLIKKFLQEGADVNAMTENGDRPLCIAAQAGQIETCRLLIERGARWWTSQSKLDLPQEIQKIIKVAEITKKAAFETLLVQIKKSQITQIDIAGDWLTAQELQQLILIIKQNPTIESCYLGKQIERVSHEDQLYLQARFIIIEHAKEKARRRQVYSLQSLIKRSVVQKSTSINLVTDIMGYTALHIAALVGESSLIQPLFAIGVAIDQKDKWGKTALRLAEECHHPHFVSALESFQKDLFLKRLQQEAQQAQRAVIPFVARQEQLYKDIESLLQLDKSEIIKSFTVLAADYWIAIEKLRMKDIDVSFCRFPSYLLRSEGFGLRESLWIRWQGDSLTSTHPMFSNIVGIIQELEASSHATDTDIQALICIYQEYVDLVPIANEKERITLSSSPTLLLGFGTNSALVVKEEAGKILAKLGTQSDQHGGHVVHKVGNIHFQLNPHAPGVEYMVGSLGNIIAKQGTTPSELLKVITPEGYPRIYLASRTVEGIELGHLIRDYPQLITQIKPSNFSAMILLSLLTNPQDGKADKYKVEFKQDGSIEIIGIDNGLAFAEPIIKKYNTQSNGRYFVNVKNILYFFPQMQTTIDEAFREEFLKRIPELVLIEWLSTLYEKNLSYQRLVVQGILSQEELSGGPELERGLQLPIKLAPGMLNYLYYNLTAIHNELTDCPEITHAQLFARLQPELAKHYTHVQQQSPDDLLKCITTLYEESIENWEEQQSFRKSSEQEQSWKMALALKTTENLGFERERTITIEESAKEFLKVIDYKKITNEMVPTFFAQLTNLNFLYPDSTLLHLAVSTHNFALVTFLLEHHLIAPYTINKEKITPLELALRQEKINTLIVECLLKYGATLSNDSALTAEQTAAPLESSLNSLDEIKIIPESTSQAELNAELALEVIINKSTSSIEPGSTGSSGSSCTSEDEVKSISKLPPNALEIESVISPVASDTRNLGKPIGKINEAGVIAMALTIESKHLNYDENKPVGRGAFGEVFKGNWKYETVAIKRLFLTGLSSVAETEFKNEASIMAQLRSDYIIAFKGIVIDQQPFCIVMAWAEKGSLYNVLRSNEELPWSLRQQLASDIAKGLSFLHAEGFLHRDLKSLNILVDKHMQAKLTDFGLSKVKIESQKISTQPTEGLKGSIRWMAPELFALEPKYSERSDVYAYAMVLWELASRKVPYESVMLDSIIMQEVGSGRRLSIPEKCPLAIAQLIKHCWKQMPQERPNATDIVEYLVNLPAIEEEQSNSALTESRFDLIMKQIVNNVSTALELANLKLSLNELRRLADLLHNNNTLLHINLRNSDLDDEKAQILLDALHYNSRLLNINLDGNVISLPMLRQFKKLFSDRQTRIKRLHIDRKQLDYSNSKQLGEGGSGEVCTAIWNNQIVAVKTLKTYEHCSAEVNNKLLMRFDREASMMASFKHPHIVQVYGVNFSEPKNRYFIMEYLSGGPLDKLIKSGPAFSISQQLSFAQDIANALRFLHDYCDTLHLDLKPGNILMTSDRRLKLTDFGLAARSSNFCTTWADIRGTCLYRAPELWYNVKNEEALTPKADIYSYGIVLWEIAFHKRSYLDSYRGDERSFYNKVVAQKKRPEPASPPHTHSSIATLIARCWDERREKRPEAHEILQELSTISLDTP